MIGKQLVNEVHKEAAKLREHATSKELNQITVKHLNPFDNCKCIYGQATGDCYSDRAHKLMAKCAVALQWTRDKNSVFTADATCKLPRRNKQLFLERAGWIETVFSPIEIYIAQDGADNRQLIRYLKGKIDTLDLTPTINC